MPDPLGFETALHLLERTVASLEDGELGLDEALAKYQEGVTLLAHCQGLLEGAERSIALLTGVDEAGRPETVPFDATATADRAVPADSRPEITEEDDLPY